MSTRAGKEEKEMKNAGEKMRDLRISRRLSQQHVVDAIAKIEPRVDVPLISRYEHGICLATPRQVEAICDLYGCDPIDIYDPEDVAFPQIRAKQAKAARGEGLPYKMTVRVPDDLARTFFEDLKICDYAGPTDFLRDCIKKLHRRAKKIAACGGTQTTTRKK